MWRFTSGAVLLALVLGTGSAVWGQDAAADRILEKIRSVRPTADDLRLFRLDWEDSVDEAFRRAAREKRPVVCFVNHADSGDLKKGHC